jgi:hypothetical protein
MSYTDGTERELPPTTAASSGDDSVVTVTDAVLTRSDLPATATLQVKT